MEGNHSPNKRYNCHQNTVEEISLSLPVTNDTPRASNVVVAGESGASLANNNSLQQQRNNHENRHQNLNQCSSIRSQSSGAIDSTSSRSRCALDASDSASRDAVVGHNLGAGSQSRPLGLSNTHSNEYSVNNGKQICNEISTNTTATCTGHEEPECPVCLQACVRPVRLPCSHIFCFLCLKGIALQNGRCALCRTGIPRNFFNDPDILVYDEDSSKTDQWFYEGTNGWWQYEERNALELEEKYQAGIKNFDMVIVGLVFTVDLTHMIQYRRNDPNKRRRIKRDVSTVTKKGVAGLKIHRNERASGDGGEAPTPPQPPVRVPLLQPSIATSIRNFSSNHHRSSPASVVSGFSGIASSSSSSNRRIRTLRRNGSDSDSASDDTDLQMLDGMPRRSFQRPAPLGDESNSSSLRTLVGAPTMYVHSANTLSSQPVADRSLVSENTVTQTSMSNRHQASHDVRIIDGQESPLYYSGMTTPSNTPRSAASGTGSPTERNVLPPHSVHFEALIDGITGLVSGNVNIDDRSGSTQ